MKKLIVVTIVFAVIVTGIACFCGCADDVPASGPYRDEKGEISISRSVPEHLQDGAKMIRLIQHDFGAYPMDEKAFRQMCELALEARIEEWDTWGDGMQTLTIDGYVNRWKELCILFGKSASYCD